MTKKKVSEREAQSTEIIHPKEDREKTWTDPQESVEQYQKV